MLEVKIDIQKDEDKQGQYKIVLLNKNFIIGVPARNLSKKEAQERVNSIQFAFEFGFMFANESIVKAISRLDMEVIG